MIIQPKPPGEIPDEVLTQAEADALYLRVDGVNAMKSWVDFSVDQSGLMFYGAGRIFKKDGGGMILRKSSGNQQWKVQNNDGGGEVAIATLNDIPAPIDAYTKAESDAKYALKPPTAPDNTLPVPPPESTGSYAVIGDLKHGLQHSDHGGWIRLDGRLVSTLTASQQSAAAGFGYTTNLPDATGAVVMQGTVLGTVSGSNVRTLTQENLPNVTLTSSSDGNHFHMIRSCINDNGKLNWQELYAGYSGGTVLWNGGADNSTINNHNGEAGGRTMDDAGSHSHTIALGGSSTPIDITPKAIAANTFLYLGA